MTSLLQAPVTPTALLPRPSGVPAQPRTAPIPHLAPVTALSRMRGGTFSPTVDIIRFADGSTAHTDLIRLNPNIDAYSLDFDGVSPRQLCHYREVGWWGTRRPSAIRWQQQITRILAAGYPYRSTGELTAQLTRAGYDLGATEIRPHEAIAATQAALWQLTNGLELDTRPLETPAHVVAHGGRDAQAAPGATGTAWRAGLEAGQPVHLELELPGAPQVTAFSFAPASEQTGIRIHLERSADRRTWRRISHSSVTLEGAEPVLRRLGHGATLSSVDASGPRGHPFGRLTAETANPDTHLDLHQVRLHLPGGARFLNNERIVALYEMLSSLAVTDEATAPVHAHVLIGAKTPDGPGVFTPLVSLSPASPSPGATPRPHHP